MKPTVELNQVTKRFSRQESRGSLRRLIGKSIGRVLRISCDASDKGLFTALDCVSFGVPEGQAIGIIGPNGAGKSTLLKLLAGILRADRGTLRVQGRLAALIEVGAGFHGDLTGRENIFLNGTILGMSRSEIRSKLDDIVTFAGLERFLDMPVKRYSSGMYARLGFSIAVHVEPDVLLVDEVLSVGDAVFRLRCLDRMRRFVSGGGTLVFVTHDLDQMQSICGRAIVLEGGRVAFDGSAADAVGHYMAAMSASHVARPTDLIDPGDRSVVEGLGVRILNEGGVETRSIRPGDMVRLALRLGLRRSIPRLVCEANLRSITGQQVVSINSGRDGMVFSGTAGQHDIELSVESMPLAPGQYFWNVRIWDADRGVTLLDTPFQYPMAIDHSAVATGVLCLPHEWVQSRTAQRDGASFTEGVRNVETGKPDGILLSGGGAA